MQQNLFLPEVILLMPINNMSKVHQMFRRIKWWNYSFMTKLFFKIQNGCRAIHSKYMRMFFYSKQLKTIGVIGKQNACMCINVKLWTTFWSRRSCGFGRRQHNNCCWRGHWSVSSTLSTCGCEITASFLQIRKEADSKEEPQGVAH